MNLRRSNIVCLIIFVFTQISYAGPTTNLEEYNGDKLLTPVQQQSFNQHLDSGIKFYENKQYDQAEKEFKAILEVAPKKNLAYFNLGLTKYRQGDYPEAIKYFDMVIKKRSYYVGAAFYYKAISQLNLDKNEEAIKTAKRFTPARFFYVPSQNLIQAIREGTDEYLSNAKVAALDENYELCLLEMEESVFTDARLGKDQIAKCKDQPEVMPIRLEVKPSESYRYKLYADTRISLTDNVYQEDNRLVGKTLYSVEVGGEYILKNFIDYGIGGSYEYSNAVDLARFKDEYYNLYVPAFYREGDYSLSGQVYYSQNKNNDTNAYSTSGGFVNYFYNQPQYSVGFVGGASNRVSLNSAFDFRNGFYSTARIVVNKYIGSLTLGAYVGYDQNLSGDQPLGSNVLPFAFKAQRVGASAAYEFNKVSKLILRSNYSDRKYPNILSTQNIKREDKLSQYSLTYNHTFNKNVSVYIQQIYVNNDSTYDQREFINKNYIENETAVGLSLVTF